MAVPFLSIIRYLAISNILKSAALQLFYQYLQEVTPLLTHKIKCET